MASTTIAAFDIRPQVDTLLARALERRVSDIHIDPVPDGFDIRFRIDGLLQSIDHVPPPTGQAIVNRLMVMARLLTYRRDIPQEGRIRFSHPSPMDLRLSVIPTLHGLRAVIRMPADLIAPQRLDELNLSSASHQFLRQFCQADSGMLVIIGPAGSGKTTTIYAMLEHLSESRSGESIVSLEDPIERAIRGVTQIEVSPFGELNYQTALKSILRQDPQILAIGEIRDGATASLAIQAALTGHRLLCTLHAGSPTGALRRLLEMGAERYQLTSSIFGFLNQRLVRRKAASGYCGRLPVSSHLRFDAEAARNILDVPDNGPGSQSASAAEVNTGDDLWAAGEALLAAGTTDEAELRRVLGQQEA